MALNVDLGELVAVAARAAEMARTTGAALPREWVVPAGADPISAAKIPELNAQAAGLFNATLGMLNEVQKLSHDIGTAAVAYAATDESAARQIAGAGGGYDITNPVPVVERLGYRRVPEQLSSMTSVTGDPLMFAQQLHSGPGPEPAYRFADAVRTFARTSAATARGDMDSAAAALRHWTPVGSEVSEKLGTYRGWLDELTTGLDLLAGSATAYGNSFATARAKHPTPDEIIAARRELVRAMRSKDEVGTSTALAKFQEQNSRSAETVATYTSETAPANSGAGAGGGDGAMLAQMMPALMSMVGAGMNGLPSTETISDDYYYDDFDTGDYGIPSLGSPGAAGVPPMADVPSPADIEQVPVGAMQTVSATTMGSATGLGAAPRAPVAETASPSSTSGNPYGRSGMPMMPMMPMSGAGAGPGAGGGGNERSRVVAWHPDRLMYVDDTPHTEQVIGERPTIAPTVTNPTPAQPNQAPTRSGGTA